MASWGSCDYRELEKFRDKIERLSGSEADQFLEECAKELAARLLRKVILKTPVGDYNTYWTDNGRHDGVRIVDENNRPIVLERSDQKGGTLRRGWTTQASFGGQGGNPGRAYDFSNIVVHHYGENYVVDIVNPVEYASYVEYGHRQTPGRYVPEIGKRLKAGWVKGHFMLTISEKEIRRSAPKVLERKFKKYLEEVFR
ncbi:MAG: HK97 gp10 family phage protein [Lachnospiraceae bacterium]|nr:HK97 gp10 family phage protein [Lachnospiraceae bacterium]